MHYHAVVRQEDDNNTMVECTVCRWLITDRLLTIQLAILAMTTVAVIKSASQKLKSAKHAITSGRNSECYCRNTAITGCPLVHEDNVSDAPHHRGNNRGYKHSIAS